MVRLMKKLAITLTLASVVALPIVFQSTRGRADRQQDARARAIQGCQIGRVESPGKMKASGFSRGFQREANEFDLGMDVA